LRTILAAADRNVDEYLQFSERIRESFVDGNLTSLAEEVCQICCIRLFATNLNSFEILETAAKAFNEHATVDVGRIGKMQPRQIYPVHVEEDP